jgi:hypothetical protein
MRNDSGVQEFRSSGVRSQESGVQEFRSSGVQEFRSYSMIEMVFFCRFDRAIVNAI